VVRFADVGVVGRFVVYGKKPETAAAAAATGVAGTATETATAEAA